MEQALASPGLFSDDDGAAAASPVLESTATGFGADVRKDLLSEFSAISPNLEGSQQAIAEDVNGKLKVYLRVRPLKPTELEKGEDQGCVCIENSETLLLKAPKDSFTMRSTERGVGQAAHRFSFTQIFGPDVGQKLFFDETMKQVVKDVLNGQNWLVYTYGNTNSGKTHTIQGSIKDGGILPRSLAVIFNSVGDRLYQAMDLKPSLCNEVIWLDSRQVRQEETKKQSMLRGGLWEEELLTPLKRSCSAESQLQGAISGSFDSGVAGLSSSSQFTSHSEISQTEELGPRWADLDRISLSSTGDVQFSIWVSFFEIYNELIYDLLEPALPGQNRKRQTLRLCEDQTGNPYVKDLNWINVCDADEAWKLLKLGRKNQSFASTHMNQNSSRSHSIFSIRILHLQGGGSEIVPKISELSLCDLAGSERCKDQKSGDRMKEANNINTSLHTLGRCITALRQKQQSKLKQIVVPFRDSKLTRVFQGFFTGRGRSCMIVNINQCASTYDETLYVAKFSAIASQLVQAPPTKLGLPSIQSIIKEHSRRTSQGSEATEKEEVKTEDSEDEVDVSVYEREDLLRAVEAARELLVQERQEKLQLEIRLRTEICNEMLEGMQQKEQWWSQHIDAQKELLEELYEDKLNNLKESLTDYYQEEIQERDEKIEELQAALQEAKQKLDAKQRDSEQGLRRSKRVAASCALQQELTDTKAKLEQCQMELNTTSSELRKYQRLLEPPPSAKPITVDVDKKLEDGQKNVRLLRSELQKLGESLQSAERACCHSTGAGKLREALCMCDDILARQDQTLAELQNNMMLVKLDLRKKAACIAEQYHTVQKLQAPPMSTLKKRFCANRENLQPNQPPGKKPFLHNLLTRSAPRPAATRGWQLRSVAL
ncbi:kinesin-like protein KIF20A isoform X1 [Centrocercus urophasianus]|uniref:kinesin-like protein KIF20A isoform X1 n=1 Tax=Centrocercus urophasianus TaxID=9002 RepID=UPI001C647ED5|nr:kinesin-like protein KIF20A isoform X1 [Centrocercus urophasianus]XP_042682033.1 kinesin-like protein KIF20A isoform X1 [Centrocercus urophasianus]XP_042682034.1 kinesin-like protein KIF20A isoform X1 [Centrocercus urophasianus]XP_042682035.1 kinesin-like protein KIF20A isoform X1 [Centrocercus urophasianus]